MRLKFYKDKEENCVKILTSNDQKLDFDYIEMIKQIYFDRGIEEAEIDDQYLDEEKESINSLVNEISKSVESLINSQNLDEDEDNTSENQNG
ncbi:MAG: hypothetical protein WBI36_06385 [Erysipelotrichaceae bacterium]